MGIHISIMDIGSKVNAIARLGFEPAYFDV